MEDDHHKTDDHSSTRPTKTLRVMGEDVNIRMSKTIWRKTTTPREDDANGVLEEEEGEPNLVSNSQGLDPAVEDSSACATSMSDMVNQVTSSECILFVTTRKVSMDYRRSVEPSSGMTAVNPSSPQLVNPKESSSCSDDSLDSLSGLLLNIKLED